MKRFSRVFLVSCVVAIALAAFVPLALAAKAAPSVGLKAKPTSVKVGKTVAFSGTVKNAVAKDKTVKLWLVKAKKSTLEKSGTITSKGAFKLTYKAAKAGTWTFRVTYKAGKTTYKSNEVKVTVTKS
jgi:hypothetical protein